MQKKLTISIDEEVYQGLRDLVGQRRISRFIEDLIRRHIAGASLEAAYAEMGRDERREAEALAWAEATLGDCADEPR